MKPETEAIGKCPHCGGKVIEKSKGFFCDNTVCKFALWKDSNFFSALSKKLTKQIAEELVTKGESRLKKCRSAKTGKTYDATVVLKVGEDGKAGFGLKFDDKKG